MKSTALLFSFRFHQLNVNFELSILFNLRILTLMNFLS